MDRSDRRTVASPVSHPREELVDRSVIPCLELFLCDLLVRFSNVKGPTESVSLRAFQLLSSKSASITSPLLPLLPPEAFALLAVEPPPAPDAPSPGLPTFL